MAKALPASCRVNYLIFRLLLGLDGLIFFSLLVATKFLVISKGEGRSPLISFMKCLRRGATHNKRRGKACFACCSPILVD